MKYIFIIMSNSPSLHSEYFEDREEANRKADKLHARYKGKKNFSVIALKPATK